jgi:hypothetical protein
MGRLPATRAVGEAVTQSASCPAGKVLKVTGGIRGWTAARSACLAAGFATAARQRSQIDGPLVALRGDGPRMCLAEKNIPAARHLLSRSLPPRSRSSQRTIWPSGASFVAPAEARARTRAVHVL